MRYGGECSLAPINVSKWKRLEERNNALEKERSEALAKMVRVSAEIESIRAKQKEMRDQELENIAVQEKEEEEAAASAKSPNDAFAAGF